MPNLLPQEILPPTTPIGTVIQGGKVILDQDWWLFLLNIAQQVLSPGGQPTPVSPGDIIDMIDLDAAGSDVPQAYVGLRNLALEGFDGSPSPDVAVVGKAAGNALLLAQGGLLPDPIPRAQPTASVTVGASPFTYTALSDGTLSVTSGTVSGISIVRQGVTVATGVTAGLIPVSRTDQVVITYSVLPTAVFLPS